MPKTRNEVFADGDIVEVGDRIATDEQGNRATRWSLAVVTRRIDYHTHVIVLCRLRINGRLVERFYREDSPYIRRPVSKEG